MTNTLEKSMTFRSVVNINGKSEKHKAADLKL